MFMQTILFCLSFFCIKNQLHASTESPPAITDIYVDPAFVIKMNDLKMAGAIGVGAIASFFAANWKSPTEEDLYGPLEGAAASSEIRIFKKGKALPLLLTDWLAGQTELEVLQENAHQHLNITSATREGTTNGNVVRNAMAALLDPEKCVALHDPIVHNLKIFRQLAQQGYNIHLAGNFAYPEILREKHGKHLDFFEEGWLISGETGLVKPSAEFFSQITTEGPESLFVEIEKLHCRADHRHLIVPEPSNFEALLAGLKKNGITLEE